MMSLGLNAGVSSVSGADLLTTTTCGLATRNGNDDILALQGIFYTPLSWTFFLSHKDIFLFLFAINSG